MANFPLSASMYQNLFSHESEAFKQAYLRADPQETVPNCPAWTVTELTSHISSIYHRVAEVIHTRSMEALDPAAFVAPSDPKEAFDYFVAGANKLEDRFRDLDPSQMIWTYAGIQPALFWFRRMTHETMVHAFDIDELHPPLHTTEVVAIADGVDEFLTSQLIRKLARQPVPGLEGRLALSTTDSLDRWVVQLSPGAIEILDSSSEADAELSGDAFSLLNFLWRRPGEALLTRSGNVALIDTYEHDVQL